MYICKKTVQNMIPLIVIGESSATGFLSIILTIYIIFKVIRNNKRYSTGSHSRKKNKPRPLPTIIGCIKQYCGDNMELYNEQCKIINSVLEKHKDDNYLDAFVWAINKKNDNYLIYQTLLPGTEVGIQRNGTVSFAGLRLGWITLFNKEGEDITDNPQCKILGAYVILRDKFDPFYNRFEEMYIRVYYSE